jgi:hypothetical protein
MSKILKGVTDLKKVILAMLVALAAVGMSGVVFANPSPNGPGQPGAPGTTCGGVITNSPPGFNTAGFANAGAHYAGSPGTPSLENANSPHAISQYDIACYQATVHGLFPP